MVISNKETATIFYWLNEKIIKVYQEIYVNKDSQKSIIIGKNGEKIKMIGTRSRIDIEKILNKKVFLDLTVKKIRI